jgi:predicted helicase
MLDFKKYINELQSVPIDEITEHSKRFALETLLREIAGKFITINTNPINVLHEPKRKENYGSPDFKIYTESSIIGYVENKKITENLDKTLKSNQIKKYRELSQNILLTNYIEFVWIKSEVIHRETLCYLSDIENTKFKLDKLHTEKVEKLLTFFFSQTPEKISKPKELAVALANRCKNLKDFLFDELKRQESNNEMGRLFALYGIFKSNIFHELELTEFADAFAQMLVYGLFLAKLNADTKLITLFNAKEYIPKSFQLIKELVSFLDELINDEYKETKWIIDETISIMNNIDLFELKQQMSFTKQIKDNENIETDPFIYFYETFLSAYDNKLRKAKGIYYTPPQVVNFIIRSINDILKNIFKISEGLASHKNVTVLDFATGTGTFLVEIFKQIFESLPPNSKAIKNLLIKEHILKNIYGFEYLIAPYTIAHLKLSQFLNENGYDLADNDRLQIFLTNTLELVYSNINLFVPQLSKEGEQAQKIKDKPILVITGNPPYSYVSKNNSKWISEKIRDYYKVDGQPLNERNPKGLQDDYVKFIRFAQYKMELVEQGVIGIITNHSFLDNPTFRGMRQSLINSFDQLYFLDLHGNAKKKEKTPDGTKDENVFDIEQGVTISILIKKRGIKKQIFHADFWGLRKEKYINCLSNDLNTIDWKIIVPEKPYYNFRPIINPAIQREYENNFKLIEIFEFNSSGIKTHKDHFAYDFDIRTLLYRIDDFKNHSISDETISEKYKIKDSRDWKLKFNREKINTIDDYEVYFKECQYRPFDNRFTFYHDVIIERPRKDIMLNFQDENLAIISGRTGQVVGGNEWNLSFITNKLTDVNLFYRGGAVVFPLYILKNGIKKTFFGVSELQTPYGNQKIVNGFIKTENFTKEFRTYINEKYKKVYEANDILGYIYGILHSPTYRIKYAEFLKIDFPSILFCETSEQFETISQLGYELIQKHLLKETPQGQEYENLCQYLDDGDNIVIKPEYKIIKTEDGLKCRLFINKTQYFDNVPENVYNFYIGGYQVLDKYLKDRKNRKIDLNEIDNVKAIVKAIAFTIKQMILIDKLTKGWI